MLRAAAVTCHIQKQDQSQSSKKEQEIKTPSSEKKFLICKHKHPVAFAPSY